MDEPQSSIFTLYMHAYHCLLLEREWYLKRHITWSRITGIKISQCKSWYPIQRRHLQAKKSPEERRIASESVGSPLRQRDFGTAQQTDRNEALRAQEGLHSRQKKDHGNHPSRDLQSGTNRTHLEDSGKSPWLKHRVYWEKETLLSMDHRQTEEDCNTLLRSLNVIPWWPQQEVLKSLSFRGKQGGCSIQTIREKMHCLSKDMNVLDRQSPPQMKWQCREMIFSVM